MKVLNALFVLTLTGGCAEITRGDPLPDARDVADTRADVADTTPDTAPPPDGDVDEVADSVDTMPDEQLPPVSFADDGVHDLLMGSCTASGCHGSGAGGYTLSGNVDADYQATLNEVTVGDGAASKLIKKATATSSHAGGPVIQTGTPEYQLLLDWIDSGANP